MRCTFIRIRFTIISVNISLYCFLLIYFHLDLKENILFEIGNTRGFARGFSFWNCFFKSSRRPRRPSRASRSLARCANRYERDASSRAPSSIPVGRGDEEIDRVASALVRSVCTGSSRVETCRFQRVASVGNVLFFFATESEGASLNLGARVWTIGWLTDRLIDGEREVVVFIVFVRRHGSFAGGWC